MKVSTVVLTLASVASAHYNFQALIYGGTTYPDWQHGAFFLPLFWRNISDSFRPQYASAQIPTATAPFRISHRSIFVAAKEPLLRLLPAFSLSPQDPPSAGGLTPRLYTMDRQLAI
jgi:hypothetical protein